MKKAIALVLLTLTLITTASAKTATFQTDQTQEVTINNEEADVEQGPTCQEMINNAQESAEGKVCGQITAEMSCNSGDKTYTAKDTCEINYLKEREWETSGNSDPQEAEIYAEGKIEKGKTLNLTVKNAEGLKAVVTGPETDRTLSVTSNVQVFNIDTEQIPKGSYTAKIMPESQGGLLAGIIGALIGGPIYAVDFQVVEPAEWQSYCGENGYTTDTVDEKISCIESQIVPTCFTENPGEKCINVAEDVCQDLLAYGYNQTSATCQPM